MLTLAFALIPASIFLFRAYRPKPLIIPDDPVTEGLRKIASIVCRH